MDFKKNFLTENKEKVSIRIDYRTCYNQRGKFIIEIERQGQPIAVIECPDVKEDPIIFSPDGQRQIPENAEKLFNDFKFLCNL